MKKFLALFLFAFSFTFYLSGQIIIEPGVSGGLVFYQGDLAPTSLRGSISGGAAYYGITLAVYPIPFVGIELFANKGKLSADDASSLAESRRIRNLSFESNITNIGARLNFELPIRIGGDHRISPVAGIGISKIYFNPKASLDGDIYELQPWGTEGQGLPGSISTLYTLSANAIPIHGGLRFISGSNWTLSVIMSQHFTSSDYIDDVSQSYPNLSLLEEIRGPMARELSDRSLGDPSIDRSGKGRGDPTDNDSYLSLTIKISKRLEFLGGDGRRKVKELKCPTF